MAIEGETEKAEERENEELLSDSKQRPKIVRSLNNVDHPNSIDINNDGAEENLSPAFSAEAPDGGWRAWLVCFTSFYCNGVMFGVINNSGVVYVKLKEQFATGNNEDSFRVSLVGSLALGSTFLLSTVASILTDKLGIRTVALAGSVMVILGMVLSSFAESLELLYVTYGIVFGAGASLVYTPSLVILGHYFKRRLGIVNGIVSAGSSIFTSIFPFLISALLSKYGLSTTYQVLAALMFPMIFCVLVFKPLVKPLPARDNIDSVDTKRRKNFCSKSSWKQLINTSIWKNKKYLVWVIAFPSSLFGYFVPLVHLVNHVKDILPGYDGPLLITCFGIASGVGRLLCGVIADIPRVNKIVFQQISFFCLGVLTMLLAAANVYGMLIAICVGLGIFDGCFISLIGPIAFSIVGVEGASQAIGFLLGICSVPLTMGPPIAGWMYDHLGGNYKLAFVAAGVAPIFGSLLMSVMFCVKEDKKDEELQNMESLLTPSVTKETTLSQEDCDDVWKRRSDPPQNSFTSAKNIDNCANASFTDGKLISEKAENNTRLSLVESTC